MLNNLFMKVNSTLSGLILILLLLSSAQAITYYNATFDSIVGHQANYDIGYVGLDYSVIVNITNTANGTGTKNVSSLTVQLLNTQRSTTNTTIDNTTSPILTCIAKTNDIKVASYKCNTSSISGANQRYMLRIGSLNTPSSTNNIIQYYQVTVASYFNTSNITNGSTDGSAQARVLLQATEVIRDRVVKLLYIKDAGNVTIGFFPNSGSGFDVALTLTPLSTTTPAPTGSIYAFGSALTGTTKANNPNNNLTQSNFTIATPGYYMLTALPTAGKPFVRLYFPSDPYTCPYNTNFPDYRQNFQPCLGSSPGGGGASPSPIVPGFPCTVFNSVAGKCTQCFTGYVLSQTGTCLYNTICPPRQYYHFGVCYDVSAKCDAFDAFTGDCLNCTNPLHYVVNGFCVPNPALIPNCTARQYILNNKCVDVSPLCRDFDNLTGGCTSCIDRYMLVAASASCMPRIVNCAANQYLKNGECVDFPTNCGNFDVANQKCVSCNFGFYPNNGGCEKIICAAGKVPSKYGLFCIDVNPSCNQVGQYDTLTGDCLRCKNEGYTVRDGQCFQNTNPLSGCAARQSLGFGACGDAKVNCQFYNLVSGDCDQCLAGWFKDYTGLCTLRSDNTRCGGDQVSIQGYCIQKPANCRFIDNLGLCTACNGPQFQLQNGQCVEIRRCGSGQYLNRDGACVNVPSGCSNGSFNPTTGVCLTCNDGRPSVNGLCCAANLVAYQGQCITAAQYQSIVSSASNSLVPTCITWHPTLGICIQCNGNSSVDPVTMNSCI